MGFIASIFDIICLGSSISDIHFQDYMMKRGGSPLKTTKSPSFSSYKKRKKLCFWCFMIEVRGIDFQHYPSRVETQSVSRLAATDHHEFTETEDADNNVKNYVID